MTQDIVGDLIIASYESGYYSAKNQLELVGISVGKRKIAREKLVRKLSEHNDMRKALEWYRDASRMDIVDDCGETAVQALMRVEND